MSEEGGMQGEEGCGRGEAGEGGCGQGQGGWVWLERAMECKTDYCGNLLDLVYTGGMMVVHVV